MYESEIHQGKWQISPKLQIISIRSPSINKYEAENLINIMKCGLEDTTKPIILIDCSYQNYITKYAKSEIFTLTEILVSTISINPEKGRLILSIKGTMPVKGITIRTKQNKISKENRQKMAEHMKKIRLKNIEPNP